MLVEVEGVLLVLLQGGLVHHLVYLVCLWRAVEHVAGVAAIGAI